MYIKCDRLEFRLWYIDEMIVNMKFNVLKETIVNKEIVVNKEIIVNKELLLKKELLVNK